MDELKRMLSLVTDADPQIRRYAISQLEMLASGDEEEEVMDVVRAALEDPVPLVRHQANRTLACLLNRSFSAPEQDFIATPSPVKGASFEGVGLARLREAGISVIRPLVDRLLAFAGSQDVEVAKRAIVALGKLALPTFLPVLTESIRNPQLTKVSAAALSLLETPAAVEPLLEAAANPEPAIRQHAILELGKFSDPRVIKTFLENAQHPNPVLRANTALALGDHTDREASMPILLSLLGDREVWVVLDALRSLGRFRDRRAVAAVMDLYKNCDDGHIQATVVSTLGRMGESMATGLIIDALKSQSERIRANAVEALVDLKPAPQELVTHLTPLLKDTSNRARANAALAIHPHAPEPAVATVDKMLASEDVWFRASAAYCLGKIQGPAAHSRLVRLLTEEQEAEVLGPAVKALESFSDNRALGPLLKLLDHPALNIRAKAARIAGRFRERDLLAQLSEKYRNEEDGSVRASLISSIGMLVEPRDLSFVAEALEKDQDPRVQSNAMMVLAVKGGLAALGHIRPFVSSTHNRLKANAVLVLFSHGEFEIVPSLLTMLDAAYPKQFYSAIYVVGEIGRSLRFLHLPQTNVHLLHSLKALFLNSSGVSPRAAEIRPIPVRSTGSLVSIEERVERILGTIVSTQKDQLDSVITALTRENDNPLVACILLRQSGRGEMTPQYRQALEAVLDSEKDFPNPAIELATHHTKTRDAKGMVMSYLAAYERAVALLQDQLSVTRELVSAGRHSEALVSLKELVHCMQIRTDRNARLGRLYLALKFINKAARHLFLAHIENPTDPEITYDYAKACFQKGDLGLARTLCQEILKTAAEGSPLLVKAKRLVAALKEQGGV